MSRNLLLFFEGALFMTQLIFVEIVSSCAIFTAWSRVCGPLSCLTGFRVLNVQPQRVVTGLV